jgi:hypothetical protein
MKKGSEVTWKWGKGKGRGKIKEEFIEPVSKKIKGSNIKRNASKENPAYLIEQENGNEVLKLKSQLEGK